MSSSAGKKWTLASRPKGPVTADNFKLESFDTAEVEKELKEVDAKEGHFILAPVYFSVDPYLRSLFNEGTSYLAANFQIGKEIRSIGIAKVVATAGPVGDAKVGDYVVSDSLPWKTQVVVKAAATRPVYFYDGSVSLSTFLGVAGLTGLSAICPLKKFAPDLKAGDTVFVSGIAGAVGMVVGQYAKLKGCKVFGSCGSDDKIKQLKEKFGFDGLMNYKTEKYSEWLKTNIPEGINVYFDNVGGEALDAALVNMTRFGKVICCGSISNYEAEKVYPLTSYSTIVTKSLTLNGFLLRDFVKEIPETTKEILGLLKEGKLAHEETLFEGFEKLPEAFMSLFAGKNFGKVIVKI